MLLSTMLITNAQMLNITGRVVDKDDEPIIGTQVAIKGISRGTATDVDGKFNLQAEKSDTLFR